MTKKARESRKFVPVDRDVRDIIDELLRAMPPARNDQERRKAVPAKKKKPIKK